MGTQTDTESDNGGNSAAEILADLGASQGEREELYKWFHQHPELSLSERETSQRIVDTLSGYGLSPKRVGDTGVVAVIANGEGPVVAMRADIDALPVREASGKDYASTATTEDDEKASQVAEKLIAAGAVTSEADDNLLTIFHRSIYTGRPSLVSTFLKVDPNAKVVLSVPAMDNYASTIFPVVSAVSSSSYSVLAVLLAHGAKLQITRDDFQRARDMKYVFSHTISGMILTSGAIG